MEIMFDTVNISDIKKYGEIFPYTGVTSNPSIIRAEGKIDFFNHFKEIRELIGFDKTLHVQVTATKADLIIKEAEKIVKNIDKAVYIKIPVTEEGLKAIRYLKSNGYRVTATAVYTKLQGLMAIQCGADYIAPYFNRMENYDMDIDATTISYFRDAIETNGYKTKILAASFKNVAQVHKALAAGAHSITIQPSLLHNAMNMAEIDRAVESFNKDFKETMGVDSILDL